MDPEDLDAAIATVKDIFGCAVCESDLKQRREGDDIMGIFALCTNWCKGVGVLADFQGTCWNKVHHVYVTRQRAFLDNLLKDEDGKSPETVETVDSRIDVQMPKRAKIAEPPEEGEVMDGPDCPIMWNDK